MVKVSCGDPSGHVCPIRKHCFDLLQIAFLISIERCLFQPEWLSSSSCFVLRAPPWADTVVGSSLFFSSLSGQKDYCHLKCFQVKKRINWILLGQSGYPVFVPFLFFYRKISQRSAIRRPLTWLTSRMMKGAARRQQVCLRG